MRPGVAFIERDLSLKFVEKRTAQLFGPWIFLAAIAVGMLGYFRLYFSQQITPEVPQLGTRGIVFLRALIPDAMYRDWTADGALAFGFLDRVPLWLAAAFWYGLAWWIGAVLLRRLPLVAWQKPADSGHGLAVRHPLAIALGLGMLSLTTFLVGCTGFLRPAAGMMIALSVWIGVGILSCMRSRKCGIALHFDAADSRQVPVVPLMRRLIQLMKLVLIVCCFYYSVAATMAPVEFDVLEYHLQAPKEFWQLGAIQFLPHNIYANMPLGIEMHALAWMSLIGGSDGWWWGALVGKVIIGWMAPLTAWLLAASLYEYSQREQATDIERDHGVLVALGAAVLYLTLPGIAEVSQFGQIDAAFGLYLLATAVVAFYYAFGIEIGNRRTTAVLLGLFAGLAFTAKYPGLMFAVVPAWIVVFIKQCRRPIDVQSLCLQSAYLALGILISAGPWLVKNAVLCGNPVYPLAGSLFGGKTLDTEKIEQWQRAHAIPVLKDAEGHDVRYSWRQAIAALQQLAYKSPIPSSILVPLLVIGTLCNPRRETWWWLCWLTGGLAVWWFMSHRLDRFWLPLLPIASWLASQAILPLFKMAAGIPLAVVLTIGVSHSLLFFASPPLNDPRYLVSLQAQRYDWKGEEFTRVSKVIGWLNDNLNSGDRVLMVGQAAVFDLAVAFDYSTCFDESKWDIVAGAIDAAERQRKFHELGITHVCIHWGEIERYRSPGNYGFRSKITQQQVAEFLAAGILSEMDPGKQFEGVSLLKVTQKQ